jgi:hypothetical protein
MFLLGQGAAQAHMIEFGSDHEHDDVACSVMVLADDEAIAPEPLEIETPKVLEGPVLALSPTRISLLKPSHPCRAPPPRAPPI